MNNVTPFRTQPFLAAQVETPMPRFVVAIRHVLREWPVQDLEAIYQERRRYDAGLVEICTGRVKDFIVLYSIPRKVKAVPRRWFSFSGSY